MASKIQIQIEIHFDTDVLSIKLYPESKKSNIQIVSQDTDTDKD